MLGLALDTGLRLNEALTLRREDLDLDNLLITVRDGKGGFEVTPEASTTRSWCSVA